MCKAESNLHAPSAQEMLVITASSKLRMTAQLALALVLKRITVEQNYNYCSGSCGPPQHTADHQELGLNLLAGGSATDSQEESAAAFSISVDTSKLMRLVVLESSSDGTCCTGFLCSTAFCGSDLSSGGISWCTNTGCCIPTCVFDHCRPAVVAGSRNRYAGSCNGVGSSTGAVSAAGRGTLCDALFTSLCAALCDGCFRRPIERPEMLTSCSSIKVHLGTRRRQFQHGTVIGCVSYCWCSRGTPSWWIPPHWHRMRVRPFTIPDAVALAIPQ
jgi:hypothetical protein